MKIATAFYDENGTLVSPLAIWQGHSHKTASTLTMEGGYWHSCRQVFDRSDVRDRVALSAMEAIAQANGTVIHDKMPEEPQWDPSTGRERYVFYLQYVIEEPDRYPFRSRAATNDRLGISPHFVYPFDGVATYGPDYSTPRAEQLTVLAAARDAVDQQNQPVGPTTSYPSDSYYDPVDNDYSDYRRQQPQENYQDQYFAY